MKSWLFSVVILFILAKALLWLQGFILPLPIYVLAGAFLAIASNYDRGIMTTFHLEALESKTKQNNAESTEMPENNSVIAQRASLVEEVVMLKESNQKS